MAILDTRFEPGGVLGGVDPNAPAPGAPAALSEPTGGGYQGFIDKIAANPALSNAFLQMGAGLLSQNKLGPALSAGFAGFNKGFVEGTELNRPKVTPLANGAFTQIAFPDGRVQIVPNDKVQEFLIEDAKRRNTFTMEKIGAQAAANLGVAGGKDDIKRGGDARNALQDTQGLIGRYQQAYDIVMPIQTDAQGNPIIGEDGQPVRAPRPRTEQALALPGVKGVAEFFGAKGASDNLKLQELTVDETLLKTAQTKGAISNAEMMLFKSPMPSPWADPKVWEEQAKKRLEVLRKIEAFQQSEIARGDNPTARLGNQPNASPAPSGGVQVLNQADVTSRGLQFDPAYEYALVNGQIKRRKK